LEATRRIQRSHPLERSHMTLFPESFFIFLIYTALCWTGLGAAVLIFLLLKDFKNKKIW